MAEQIHRGKYPRPEDLDDADPCLIGPVPLNSCDDLLLRAECQIGLLSDIGFNVSKAVDEIEKLREAVRTRQAHVRKE